MVFLLSSVQLSRRTREETLATQANRSSMLTAVSVKKIVEFQKFCYHGNVTSHFSSLLRLRIPCQGNSYVYCTMISGQNVLS